MIEVNIPLGNFRFQFIKDDPGVLRYVYDQSDCDKCDSHAVTGQVVGSDLLIKLQGNIGCETRVLQEQIIALTCVVSCPQKQERVG